MQGFTNVRQELKRQWIQRARQVKIWYMSSWKQERKTFSLDHKSMSSQDTEYKVNMVINANISESWKLNLPKIVQWTHTFQGSINLISQQKKSIPLDLTPARSNSCKWFSHFDHGLLFFTWIILSSMWCIMNYALLRPRHNGYFRTLKILSNQILLLLNIYLEVLSIHDICMEKDS